MENTLTDLKEEGSIKKDKDIDISLARERMSNTNNQIIGARLPGSLRDNLILMKNKQLSITEEDHKLRLFGKDGVLIFCFDGAQHCRNKKSLGIVTFSMLLYSLSFYSGWNTTSSSQSILTFQQFEGSESTEALKKSLQQFFEELVDVRKDCLDKSLVAGCKVYPHHLLDYSALYKIKSHTSWSSDNAPYWGCACNKGDGCKDLNHKCIKITHEEEVEAYNNSKKKWGEWKKKFPMLGKKKMKKKHRKWASTDNKGIMHFGIHPDKLPTSEIRPDVFHMCNGIVKRLMTALRSMLTNSNGKIKRKFYNKLREFWEDGHVLLWRLNKSFNSFIGCELQQFSAHARWLGKWMKEEKLISIGRPDFVAMCDALILWTDIEFFLKRGRIHNLPAYEEHMKKFNKNVDKFYEAGTKCFLNDGKKLGGNESAYLHTLKFYMKDIVQITWDRHSCGPGIFTMQGVCISFSNSVAGLYI